MRHPVTGSEELGTVIQSTPGSPIETGTCDLQRQNKASGPWDLATFALRSPLNERPGEMSDLSILS